MSDLVSVRAPGKINLALAVGAPREDGYHPLATVFHAIDRYETVTAEPRLSGISVSVRAQGADAADWVDQVPTDERNLAYRAAAALLEEHGLDEGVHLTITKGLPVAGGMAGGSADAAAALVACAELWSLGLSRDELTSTAATLGADVPFALHGHTMLGRGIGDELFPVMTRGPFHWVIATRAEGLSTPAVYREFDRQVRDGEREIDDPHVDDALMSALLSGDPERVGEALSNDLQGPALSLAPDIGDTIEAMLRAEALGAIVSGSGPTVVGLAASRHHALAMSAELNALRVADNVMVASGPAPGATIVQEL